VFELDGVTYHRESKAWANPFLGSFLTKGPNIDDDGWCSAGGGKTNSNTATNSGGGGGGMDSPTFRKMLPAASSPTRLDANRSFFQKAAKQVYGWLKDRRGLHLESAERDAIARQGPGFLTRGIALERSSAGGFGFDVAIDDHGIVIIAALYRGGPAEAAGVAVGDALVGVDQDILVGAPGEQICKRIHTVDDKLAIKVASHARVLDVLNKSPSPSRSNGAAGSRPSSSSSSSSSWFSRSTRKKRRGTGKSRAKGGSEAKENTGSSSVRTATKSIDIDAEFYFQNFW